MVRSARVRALQIFVLFAAGVVGINAIAFTLASPPIALAGLAAYSTVVFLLYRRLNAEGSVPAPVLDDPEL